jgi:hypothetical protein
VDTNISVHTPMILIYLIGVHTVRTGEPDAYRGPVLPPLLRPLTHGETALFYTSLVEIRAPASRLEDAKRALDEAKRVGEKLDSGTEV